MNIRAAFTQFGQFLKQCFCSTQVLLWAFKDKKVISSSYLQVQLVFNKVKV